MVLVSHHISFLSIYDSVFNYLCSLFSYKNELLIFPLFPINKVLGISQNKSIVKSSGSGSLNKTLALKCPTRIEGKKLLVEDFDEVDKSKQEKK